ncbi:MAG: hypothetical protein IJ719_11490 [Clostridia bacterium]|nr:hypothetical protein [Clostridia bacterium]
MNIEYEEIQQSQDIIAYLLQNHELSDREEHALYRAFTENETVQTLVRSQGESLNCSVVRYSDVIYLVPNESNTFLGYSSYDLRRLLCKSNATTVDYYLVQFTILILLLEFYGGAGSTSKVRDYLRVGELQNSIQDHLKEGADLMDEDIQRDEGIAFGEMLRAYSALHSDPESLRRRGQIRRTTKEGFLVGILHFLSDQGLIQFVENDGIIKTTQKLDHFMDWNLLNQENYQHIMSILGAPANE